MRIAVTGGSGFIGTHLCNALVLAGHSVLSIDNYSRKDSGNRKALIPGVEPYFLDFRDTRTPTFSGADMVIHLAAKVGGINYYLNNAYEVASDNIKIDSKVIDAVLTRRIPRFMYVSSAHAELPNLSYGLGKLVGEKLTEWMCLENGIQAVVPRLVGIYGPYQDSNKATGSVIPAFVREALETGKITCLTDGNELRSYYHVEDCVQHLVERTNDIENYPKETNTQPYNVGSNSAFSLRGIAECIRANIGSNVDIKYSNRKASIFRSCPEIDSSVMQSITLNEGIQTVINEMRERL